MISRYLSETVISTFSAVTISPSAIAFASPSTRGVPDITGSVVSNTIASAFGRITARDTSAVSAEVSLFISFTEYDESLQSSSVIISEPPNSEPVLLDLMLYPSVGVSTITSFA